MVAQGAKGLVFQGGQALVGRQKFGLELLELLSDKTLGVCKRLFSDVVGRNQIIVGPCDLQVVTEHLVVGNFEVFDAGLFALPGLDVGHGLLAVANKVANTVDLGGVAVCNDAALADGDGQISRAQCALQQFHQVRHFGHVLFKLAQSGTSACAERQLHAGHKGKRCADGAQLSGVGVQVKHPRHQTLQIGELAQSVLKLLSQRGV